MSGNKVFGNREIDILKHQIEELQSNQTKNPIKIIANKKEIKKLQKEIKRLNEKKKQKYYFIGMSAFVAVLALIITVMTIRENAERVADSNSQKDTECVIVQDVDRLPTEEAKNVSDSDVSAKTIEDSNTTILLEEQESEEEAKKAEEEAAKKKAAEEAAKKAEEEAAKKKAEEEAAKKAEEEAAKKKAEEEAAKKAEEEAAKKKAEEEAAKKAEEEAAAQQAAQQPDSSTVANGTETSKALKVLQMGPTTGNTCWVPRSKDGKYHSKSSCSQMVDPIKTTTDTAIACGYDACKKCY